MFKGESMFHSQCGEDKWLAENWATLGLPDVGYFVELGAGDGIYLSNTLWLEREKGWGGLLIEGDPRQEVQSRGNCIIDRCVVGVGRVSFGLHPTDSNLSGVNRPAIERMETDARTLTEIFDQHRIERVDLISIDTEGSELEVWRTIDQARWRPAIAIIELYTWKLADRSKEIISAMLADGYELIHRTDLNGIFRLKI